MASETTLEALSTTIKEAGKATLSNIPSRPQTLSNISAEEEVQRIKYRVQYINRTHEVLHERETAGPNLEDDARSNDRATAFEILTTYQTDRKGIDLFDGPTVLTTSAPPTISMRIFSNAIIHALRTVVKYYPSQDLSSDIIEIPSPYAVLVHHYDDLMAYRERLRTEDTAKLCYRERDAFTHLGVLKDFLDQTIMDDVAAERERNQRGYMTFDMQWVALPPGKPFIGNWSKNDEAYIGIMHSMTGGSFSALSRAWQIDFWVLEYDGTNVGRVIKKTYVDKFDGESSAFMKAVDLEKKPLEENVQTIIDQGKKYWKLLKGKDCNYFKGQTEDFPHNEIDGLVRVDLDDYYATTPLAMPNLIKPDGDTRTWISDCTCPVCSHRRDGSAKKSITVWQDYEIYPEVMEELEDHLYMLLPSRIWTYVFKTRAWERLLVDGFDEPDFDQGMIENLVMDKNRVKMLKALAKSFARQNQFGEQSLRPPWSADFVKGKGNGLIFLLHGKPGVGKTCTAECIAAYTSRPLMVLTASDIGTDPVEIERNLTNHFKRARSWGAVLLIDEADVFMERRSATDLARNSLVAGFLRALEFYNGILFLTTNRVGSFDDAFISRIHVQLYYPDFDEESRQKIWQTFIDKLVRERGDYIRLNIDAKEYLRGKELKAMQWNGREIRNAFQTAVALAEYEATKDEEGKILLTDAHLKSVVEMSRDFKEYLNELHHGDESKRAERRLERLDRGVTA